MNELFYINFSGFNLVVINELEKRLSLKDVKKKSILEWKYVIISRKIVSFPIIFKNLLDHYSSGTCYVKIFFYELREHPIELLIHIYGPRTLILLDGSPSLNRLLKRIIANPKYGESLMFIGHLDDRIEELSKYSKVLKLARKLFTELSPVVYSRGIGRFIAIKLREKDGSLDLVLCVSREGVSMETTYHDIKLNIQGIDRCFK